MHFCCHSGSQQHQSWVPNSLKIHSKSIQNFTALFIYFWIHFGRLCDYVAPHVRWCFRTWAKRRDPAKVLPLPIYSRVRAFHGASKINLKINKNINQHLHNFLMDFNFVLEAIWPSFWLHFWSKFHGKTHSKFHRCFDRFWDGFWLPFWSNLAPKIDPKLIQAALGAKGAPRSMPGSLRSFKRLPKWNPKRTQGPQNQAFGHPKASKMELQTPKMDSQISPEFRKRSLAQNFTKMPKLINISFETQKMKNWKSSQMNKNYIPNWIQHATNLEPKFDAVGSQNGSKNA